jgi:hypothetical protein
LNTCYGSYLFFLALPFSPLDFGGLDLESPDFDSDGFESDDFESAAFELEAAASLDLESDESLEFGEPASPDFATDVLSALFPL